MKKRCISLGLCLALGMGLPAYAADTQAADSKVTAAALTDGVLQFDELENCIRNGNPSIQACTESMAKLNSVNRQSVVDTLKKADNALTNAIWYYGAVKGSDTTALQSEQEAIEDQLDDYSKENYAETYQGSVLQIDSGVNQIMKASQTLYFGIVKLDYAMETVQRGMDALSRGIAFTKVRCATGQASADTLRLLQDQYTDVKSQLTVLQVQSKNNKTTLQSMIGLAKPDGSIQVSLPEAVSDTLIAAINLNSDITQGKAANATIYQDQQAVDDAKEDLDDMPFSPLKQHAYQQAVYTLSAAQSNFAVQATALYQTLLDNRRLYQVSQTDLVGAQKTYALAQRKYTVGLISKLDLQTAQDTLSTAQENVELAVLNLNSAYAVYSWVHMGIASA